MFSSSFSRSPALRTAFQTSEALLAKGVDAGGFSSSSSAVQQLDALNLNPRAATGSLSASGGEGRGEVALSSIPVTPSPRFSGSFRSAFATVLTLLTLTTLFTAPTARADDSVPACWRGQPGSTYADWSFATSANPAAPDSFANPNGTPQAALVVGAFGSGWRSLTFTRSGVWDLGQAGHATLTIPNFTAAPAPPWKMLQVQITYFDAPGFYLPPTVSIAGASLLSSQTVSNQTVAPGAWKTYQTLWLLQPAPPSDTILLSGDAAKGLLIDEIIVDTIVAPDFPCPADIIASADPGHCSKSNVTWTLPAADGCIVTNVTSTPPNGSTFNVGTNQVTSVITDRFGRSKTCNFTVVILSQLPADFRLTITPAAPNSNLLNICWPVTCSPAVLEYSDDLTPPATWNPVGGSVQPNGNYNCTTISPTATMKFFRVKVSP